MLCANQTEPKLLPSPSPGGSVFVSVSPFVRLFVCKQNYVNNSYVIFMKPSGIMKYFYWRNPLNFVVDAVESGQLATGLDICCNGGAI